MTTTTLPETTMQDFVTQHKLTMSAVRTDRNVFMEGGGQPMDHWRVTVRHGKARMSLVFSQGSGFMGREPALADVLNSLALDTSGFDTTDSFEAWAADLGYSTDSMRAAKVYKQVGVFAGRLRRLLGDDAYEQLLYHTERL